MKPFEIFPHEGLRCYFCRGTGWLCQKPGDTWPTKCPRCEGRRKLSLGRIGRIIGEGRHVLPRVRDGEVGRVVGARVVEKLVRHFPEAFA